MRVAQQCYNNEQHQLPTTKSKIKMKLKSRGIYQNIKQISTLIIITKDPVKLS